MERRQFLASLMAVPVVAGAGNTRTSAAPVAAPASQPGIRFTEERFRGLVGERFQVSAEGWRSQLTLTEVVTASADPRTEQFTTIFRAGGQPLPAAGLYEVEHPQTGRFALRLDGHRESDFRLAAFALLR